MNVIQSKRTMDDLASFQQMKDIFSDQESSFNFIEQMKRRSHTGQDMTRVACDTRMIQSTMYVYTVAYYEQILAYMETIYIFIFKGKGATPDRIYLVLRHSLYQPPYCHQL